ncbi:MAG: P1 family peptidase [Bryobacteraceae bacterium]
MAAQNDESSRSARRNFLQTVAVATAGPSLGGIVADAGSITQIAGVRVGHFTDSRRPTGCTVVLFENGAVGGVDVRGSAPGTRETDLLHPLNTVQQINAILLSGGAAFGLDAATGVMRFLEEHEKGFRVGRYTVPIVPAAILFDLNIGDGKIRPDADSGYAACKNASEKVEQGNVGAGAGATVGKMFGTGFAMKSGLGTASVKLADSGLIVAAIVAVNAVGDVLDHQSGKLLAGARTADGKSLRNTMANLINGAASHGGTGSNTTIGLVATNATLTKNEINKVAQMGHDGLARSISPVHTGMDGDTVFAAATGGLASKADVSRVGALGAEALARAVRQAVLLATSIPGYPAHRDLTLT